MGKFATLRDMINWCIEKPNQGEKIDSDSEAMKALETYIYWSNAVRCSCLENIDRFSARAQLPAFIIGSDRHEGTVSI